MRLRSLSALVIGLALAAAPRTVAAQRPLDPADIDDIARLVMLEDRRELDDTSLGRILRSTHPEVRRRAAIAVGRIGMARGRPLLAILRSDADIAVVAGVVLSTGQLVDSASVGWLASLLSSPLTPPIVGREAARSLGKIRTAEARAALASFLTSAPATVAVAPIVGEALLSIGRFSTRGDLAPVVQWTTSPDR